MPIETVYPLSPQERLLSSILNAGVTLRAGNQSALTATLEQLLTTLKPQEARVLRLRFGIRRGGRTHKLLEIGEALHLTQERIRQIEVRALRKLRTKANMDLLAQAFDLSRVKIGKRDLSAKENHAWGPPRRKRGWWQKELRYQEGVTPEGETDEGTLRNSMTMSDDDYLTW